MAKPRFSMLLLEPGEIYFEDFSCKICDSSHFPKEQSQDGLLKVCSKSLVFEPSQEYQPLLKIHLKDILEVMVVSEKSIKIKMKQYTEMLEGNILAPYKFKYSQRDIHIYFNFVMAEEILRQVSQLQRASTLYAPEHESMIATIMHSCYMRMVFDTIMMDDFTEEIVLELPVERITPLVRNPGKLAMTATMLYFQPFNNVDGLPMLKLKLNKLERVFKRRFLLRQVGLEIYCSDNCQTRHLYLSFQCEEDRNTVYNQLVTSDQVNLTKIHPEEMMLQWQNGVVSNYDYLLYLNCLADRSKNDLSQYPVFPWVLTDYTSEHIDLNDSRVYRDLSKPVGALNPTRLARLKERYKEMAPPKFLYGSHYSAPGLVLFYLVRKYPQYMLCLQNGRFDHPDRMFNSVATVFANCYQNMADFKELVPEFYDTELKGDFLCNMHEIDFGERHDGSRVGDVELPPWAASPERFVAVLRDALESEHVSNRLHAWIDLVFGYKQRGPDAVKADNVFHHVCYEGSVDLENVLDMNDRHALEVQIMEFGQVPRQLFDKPHVKRIMHKVPRPLADSHENVAKRIDCICKVELHKEEVTCVVLSGSRIISVGKDGVLKVYCLDSRKQIRSVSLYQMPLSCCVMLDENTVAAGSWDNEVYVYNVEFGKLIDNFRAHDDSVNCLLWIQPEGWLVSGGLDCAVRVWAKAALKGLLAELDHEGKVVALTYRRRKTVHIISGTSDGEVYVWDLGDKSLLVRLSVHSGAVTALACMQDRVLTAGQDGCLKVTDLTVSNTVFSKSFEEALSAIWCDGRDVLWLGSKSGSLFQWNIRTVTQLASCKPHSGAITCIWVDEATDRMATSSADRSIIVWKLSAQAAHS